MTVRSPLTTGVLVALGAAAAIGALALAGAPRGPVIDNVVVITLDTTRADRLSPYGYMDVSLPALERLAAEGVVFDQATSVAPLTLPAHTSIFTGLLPPRHGVRDNADPPLADARETLADILRSRGFRTGAFVSSVVLAPDRGLKQGFDEYRAMAGAVPADRQRPANEVIDDAIRWLDAGTSPRFFLWTHLYDPHRPYEPPEPYRTKYGHNPYVGEIAFMDSQIARLLETLEKRRLLDRTLIVVAGDHGESLGEHGERDHGVFLYENVLRVPLIIRAPQVRPTRVQELVRLTDLMPTILDLLALPAAPADGVSLVDVMQGRAQGLGLEAYSESLYPERMGWSPLHAIRDARFKMIDAPRPELYDLEQDPMEENNLYDKRRALAEKMTARARAIASGPGAVARPDPGAVSPEVGARLAALGYLAGPRDRQRTSMPIDPKDCVRPDAVESAPIPPACAPWRYANDLPPSRRFR